MPLHAGTRLGPYEIVSAIGAGGMGEVYRAVHMKLGREAAIKVLPADLADDRDRVRRFEREARAASALNHPGIVTIYDIGEQDGTSFIAMELVEGRSLRQRINEGRLGLDEALRIAEEMAEALARAHDAGVVHRDLKPDNVMITNHGHVKILDFGLAKLTEPASGPSSEAPTLSQVTRKGGILGTVPYMSPEQASGFPVEHTSDQFSFGVVLYEMLCGRRPFRGESAARIVSAILSEEPPRPTRLRAEIPRAIEDVVRRCLEKEPEKRYASTAELRDALARARAAATAGASSFAVSRRAAAAVLLLLIGVAAAILLWPDRETELPHESWDREAALAEIGSLVDDGQLSQAYLLARVTEERIAGDPELETLLDRFTSPAILRTVPEGAEVSFKPYETPEAEWHTLGTTPLETRMPYGMMRLRIEKAGFEPIEGAPFEPGAVAAFTRGLQLEPIGTRPRGMVRVGGGSFSPAGIPRLPPPKSPESLVIGPYWLDRFEVTNREFKEFVAAGGYRNRALWQERFVTVEGEVSFEEAMSALRDTTGRPAPANWELGTYPEGTAEHPVGGLSWYEADAYCRWAGKSLPTIYHWFHAIGQAQRSELLMFSNFSDEGPARVGSYEGIAGWGSYDMAGNVKEWCWNPTREGRRYVLGGAWNERSYIFKHLVARWPFERQPTHGVRCARYPEPPAEVLREPVDPLPPRTPPAPISDEIFEAYVAMYDYEQTDLEARVERIDESSPYWIRQTVSFRTAYDDERMEVILFLPRNVAPPYQTVVWFPGGDVYAHRTSDTLASPFLFDFLPRSGRALVYPIYWGTYERFKPPTIAPIEWRDDMLRWSKDVRRTIDYLETRDDLDHDRLAYYGFSWGATLGPVHTAIETRFKASILIGAGLIRAPMRPEMDSVHFAPRSRTPTLIIDGRDDFILPYESSQKPFFDLLGAPDADKRLARLDGGHIPVSRKAIIREVLDWLDRYLGPVAQGTGGSG